MKQKIKVRRRKTGHTGIGRLQVFNEETNKWENKRCGAQYTAQKIQWVDGKKRQVERHFCTLREAQYFRQFGNQLAIVSGKGILMGELFERFFERQEGRVRRTSFDSDLSKRKHLENLMEIPVAEFTPQHLDAWLAKAKLPDNLALHHTTRVSFDRELNLLRKIFAFAVEHLEVISKSPILARHKEESIIDPVRYKMNRDKNQVRYLSEAQIKSLLGIVNKFGSNSGEKLCLGRLLEFQLETGTRIAEAAAIQWEMLDLTFEAAKAEISATVQWLKGKSKAVVVVPSTKTYEKRVVPLRAPYARKLAEWRILSGKRSGLVFSDSTGKPFTYRSIQHFYDQALKEAGLNSRGTHIIRHTFATRFLAHTRNQVALKAILGHKHLSQTDHYAKVIAEVPTQAMVDFDLKLRAQNEPSPG